MGKIDNWTLFLEKNANSVDTKAIETEASKIISEYFTKPQEITLDGVTSVEFKAINKKEYELDYGKEPLKIERTEGVQKKRPYAVSLISPEKKDDETFKLKFKINVTSESEKKSKDDEVWMQWEFDKKPKEAIAFLKEEGIPYKWNSEDKILAVKKDKVDDELKSIINDEGGDHIKDKKGDE